MKKSVKIKLFSILWLGLGLILAACSDNATNSPTQATTNNATNITVATTAPINATSTTANTIVAAATTNANATGAANGQAQSVQSSSTPAATNPTVPASQATTAIASTTTLKAQVRPLLDQLWQTYKSRYIQGDGRVSDPQRDASTSEGEAYGLLRSFWQDDRVTFDAIMNWSISNLQNPRGDKLFAYLWGHNTADNSWKVLDPSNATDADQDIVFALLLANKKWNDSRYLTLAQQILPDLWSKNVVTIAGKPYLTAGDWGPGVLNTKGVAALNPSYFAPYEYRLFAQQDPDKSHNWLALLDAGYDLVNNCTTNKLDTATGKLPPNWCGLAQNGTVVAASTLDKGYTSDYGYDAFRTVWRLALDYQWYGEKRALTYLQGLTLFPELWKTNQKLAAVYDHTGQPKEDTDDLGIYGGSGLALFTITNPTLADQMVAGKLLPRLAQDTINGDPDPAHVDSAKGRTYYAQNWTWFGLALYDEALPQPQL